MPPVLNDFENRPFPSSKNSHFQNEAKYKTFPVKMSFACMRIKIGFLSMTPHLASLWNRGLWQIGNGLLKRKKPGHHVTGEKECVRTSFNCGCHLFCHNAIYCVPVCFIFIGSSINLSRKPSDQSLYWKSFKVKSQNITGSELFNFIIWQCNSDIFLSTNSGKR